MGVLHYGSSHHFDFTDRQLTHLRSAIISKLLQQESFALSWEVDGGQTTIWIDPAIPIVFELDDGIETAGTLNREWVEAMVAQASMPSGIKLGEEPTQRDDAKAPTR